MALMYGGSKLGSKLKRKTVEKQIEMLDMGMASPQFPKKVFVAPKRSKAIQESVSQMMRKRGSMNAMPSKEQMKALSESLKKMKRRAPLERQPRVGPSKLPEGAIKLPRRLKGGDSIKRIPAIIRKRMKKNPVRQA